MDWKNRIISDPNICHGVPCIQGTRIMVSVILDNLAEGNDATMLLREYPSLTLDDIHAAISYAAELARERFVPLETRGFMCGLRMRR
ncbi:MAG: DUF433 domain-containing protein [Planctomycetaceae bacterium]|jgi:uncharacterized protein (DUF433 family)|nr:DUF433 domain-containing protein [Planctomycetaceae bacterium]